MVPMTHGDVLLRHAGAVTEDCEVDSVWHKYDMRRAADSRKAMQPERNTFVTQRRRQLRSIMWDWT